jgi:hypothetical protein
VAFVAQGHALTEDYKVTLDLRKEDAGFARFGVEQFRHYYDDHGPYYPFRASGFATQTPKIFDLDRDLHLDVGRAFAEFGLTLPDVPRVVLGYEYQFRNGSQSTEEWGPVTQRTGGTNLIRHIFPARKDINEDVHVLRLDVSHDVAGVHVEDNMRAEFWDLKTARAADTSFPAGQLYPAAITETRETHDQLLFANTLRGEKSVKDWLFMSAGYLFSRFDADATFAQNTVDGAGRPADGRYWTANNIVLSESAHLFNLNALGGPWDGLTVALGLQNEWAEQRGFGRPNYLEGDADDPLNPLVSEPGLVASILDRMEFEENAALRYTAIPSTVLFAEAKWKQERSGRYDEQFGDHDFLRDTDATIDWQEYRAGFDVSPWRWGSLKASYKHRARDSDYDHNRDEQPHGTYGQGYPGFILSRQIDTDGVEVRLALRPASWVKTTLSYQFAATDYDTRTQPAFFIAGTNAPVSLSPGGHILAGTYDVSTYSANVTLTPWRRWYLSTTLSYQESRTRTEDNGSLAVAPYRGDIVSVLANSTFAVTKRTDLTGNYSFSRARFGQHNAAGGLPLGIDYDLHGVQFGVMHRLNTNITAGVQYGFFQYDEPTAHGFNDYTAHMVFATLAVRLP